MKLYCVKFNDFGETPVVANSFEEAESKVKKHYEHEIEIKSINKLYDEVIL